MSILNLHTWVMNHDPISPNYKVEEDLNVYYTTYRSSADGTWRIYRVETGLEYGSGTLEADGAEFKLSWPSFVFVGPGLYYDNYENPPGVFSPDKRVLFRTSEFEDWNMVLELTLDDPICWTATYRRKGFGERLWSTSGPGRFPSILLLPEDVEQDSVLLVEDGIVVPTSKFRIGVES